MEESGERKLEHTPTSTNVNVAAFKSISQPTTPSSSLSPFLFRNRREKDICAPEENLPNSSISQLWKMPLKVPNASGSAGNPGQFTRRTPTRKKLGSVPPTKLALDEASPSDTLPNYPGFQVMRSERDRAAYRRSLSHPESGKCGTDSCPSTNPKRLKMFDETSPYDELMKPQSLSEHGSNSTSLTPAVKKLFVKSQSDSQLTSCNITAALEKIESNPNLIGDASMSYILPVMETGGKHPDLKEITGKTLAKLLEEKEDFMPGVSYKIIDCRYPYEYEGGHIRGAVNYYSKNQIRQELLEPKTIIKSPSKFGQIEREVIIFHCEFSSHRGPGMCRYLRDIDRSHNATSYPFLFYPELYVLFGGYKDFYNEFPHLCDPQSYVPMDHPAHESLYRRYKSVNKLRPVSERRLK